MESVDHWAGGGDHFYLAVCMDHWAGGVDHFYLAVCVDHWAVSGPLGGEGTIGKSEGTSMHEVRDRL